MKLITELYNDSLEYITEGKESKKLYIKGIFMQSEQLNRNKRIYPKYILEKAVERYVNEKVKTNRAVGEMEHPNTPSINLDRVSHRITDLKFEGNDVIGQALILDTPMGQIAKGLIEGGVQLGVSSRGLGSLEQRDGSTYVNEDFQLATVDIVQDPSAPQAFVNGIMEGVDWVYNAESELYEKTKKEIEKTPISQINEKAKYLFAEYLKEIMGKLS